jgi:hypothetical protein
LRAEGGKVVLVDVGFLHDRERLSGAIGRRRASKQRILVVNGVEVFRPHRPKRGGAGKRDEGSATRASGP